MNANTAAIAQGYAEGVIQSYNQTLQTEGVRPGSCTIAARRRGRRGLDPLAARVPLQPGLVHHLVYRHRNIRRIADPERIADIAATAMVKERERGTVEQLLMTPATTTDIVIAKIAPLFVLLMRDGRFRDLLSCGCFSMCRCAAA